MDFLKYIIDNYGGDLITISLVYIGLVSIILMFFPLSKIMELLGTIFSVIISIFKR